MKSRRGRPVPLGVTRRRMPAGWSDHRSAAESKVKSRQLQPRWQRQAPPGTRHSTQEPARLVPCAQTSTLPPPAPGWRTSSETAAYRDQAPHGQWGTNKRLPGRKGDQRDYSERREQAGFEHTQGRGDRRRVKKKEKKEQYAIPACPATSSHTCQDKRQQSPAPAGRPRTAARS